MKLSFAMPDALLKPVRRCGIEMRRWGWPGALGAGLVLGAALIAMGFGPAARAELGEFEIAVDTARLQALNLARSQHSAAAVVDPADRFRAAFAPAQQRHQRLASLMLLAGSLGLEARRGEFREVQEPQLGLWRYRLTLPLVGSYAAVRQFTEQALREDTALSLDNLRIERSDVQSDSCRVELQFSLWMRPEDAKGQSPLDAPLALSSTAGLRP